jgi:hypothetical protein
MFVINISRVIIISRLVRQQQPACQSVAVEFRSVGRPSVRAACKHTHTHAESVPTNAYHTGSIVYVYIGTVAARYIYI